MSCASRAVSIFERSVTKPAGVEEKAKMEQQRLDSLNSVIELQRQDSIASAEKMAQDALAAAQQVIADSLRMKAESDSIAAAEKSKSKKKVKPVIKKSTEWKAGQGKG